MTYDTNNIKRTGDVYGFLWARSGGKGQSQKWHFDHMQEAIDIPIVRGSIGIEVGSGCGYDSAIMSRANPAVRLVSMDLSEGIFETARRTADLANVLPVRCSALDLPFKSDLFDFAYSFGVLHHTPDPQKGFSEIARTLKKGSPAFVYLYEDHSENIAKSIALRLVTLLRMVTTRMPPKVLYVLLWAASPFVYLLFTLPAKIMGSFGATRGIAGQMPFNFGTHPFSLQGDLYDRFSAPIEIRFSRAGMQDIFLKNGFRDIRVTRLKDTAGWVAWGFKG